MRQAESKRFYDNCVDLDNGDDKPQIRVHGNATFNVTNLMQFENIEFTAEDKLLDIHSYDLDDW